MKTRLSDLVLGEYASNRLPDGKVFVADWNAGEIRVHKKDGMFVRNLLRSPIGSGGIG